MPTPPKIERHPLQPFLPKNARLLMLGSFPPPIAIFDTAQAVRRLQGNAADEHLEIVEQTDIAAILQQLPQCHDICCTGGKATETLAEILHTATPKVGEFIETTFADRTIRFWRMPSTSRAYPLPFDKKAAAYQRMFKELQSVRWLSADEDLIISLTRA
ncbi:MAG: uracil-DNA glycosylase family protein [Paludibacteraceae bacterium]|nr:uracil-DNA glycosylase family protein [Paludibacteraceae bacterium]